MKEAIDPHTGKQAFYRRLTTWCLAAPFVSVALFTVVPYVSVKYHFSSGKRAINQVLRIDVWIAIVVLVTGIAAGIYAFRKTRKSGRKGIVWKLVPGLPLGWLLLALVCIIGWELRMFHFPFARRENPPGPPMQFDGPSTQLVATQIVPTLDAPIQEGRNAIWCASFTVAWKMMARDFTQGPPVFDQPSKTVDALILAADPRPDIPDDALCAAAGWGESGIVQKITTELQQKFPGKTPPVFPGMRADAYIAYSYLEAKIRFPLPYFQNREPLTFTDSTGKVSKLSSFGIRKEDDYAYDNLREQVKVLFHGPTMVEKGDRIIFDEEMEFAVDMSRESSPSEIILARIARQPSLAAAISYVEREIGKSRKQQQDAYGEFLDDTGIGANDVLLVPDIFWRISHRFTELEGREFKNAITPWQKLLVAQEDISFRLDRSGAELSAESKLKVLPIPTHYVMDRPFLIFMRKRGALNPYFAMWVDNAELLCPWKAGEVTVPQPSSEKTTPP